MVVGRGGHGTLWSAEEPTERCDWRGRVVASARRARAIGDTICAVFVTYGRPALLRCPRVCHSPVLLPPQRVESRKHGRQ